MQDIMFSSDYPIENPQSITRGGHIDHTGKIWWTKVAAWEAGGRRLLGLYMHSAGKQKTMQEWHLPGEGERRRGSTNYLPSSVMSVDFSNSPLRSRWAGGGGQRDNATECSG